MHALKNIRVPREIEAHDITTDLVDLVFEASVTTPSSAR